MKKKLLLLASFVMVAALAIAGTVAYLTDTDDDVNVMTLGNVKIEQLEYQRVVNEDGTFETKTIDDKESYVLEPFEQAKPLYPSFAQKDARWDETTTRLTQVGSYGGMDVFENALAQDKFVFVKNTGKSDAYVRTIIAFEAGSVSVDEWSDLIGTSHHFTWDDPETIGVVEIDGNNYVVVEYVYKGWNAGGRHVNGVLPAGEMTYCNLAQVYMKAHATNEDVEALDGNKNGTYDILVISQAVQAKGFDTADAALTAGFGEVNADNAAEWFSGMKIPNLVYTAEQLKAALANGGEIVLGNDITAEETLNVTKETTLNLNGYTLNVSSIVISEDATLQNGDIIGTPTDYSNAPAAIVVTGGAAVTINKTNVTTAKWASTTEYQGNTYGEILGMLIKDGAVVMNDSDIIVDGSYENVNMGDGFGVSIYAGSFELNGGYISFKEVATSYAVLFRGSSDSTQASVSLNDASVTATNLVAAMGKGTCTVTLNNTNADYTNQIVENRFSGEVVVK